MEKRAAQRPAPTLQCGVQQLRGHTVTVKGRGRCSPQGNRRRSVEREGELKRSDETYTRGQGTRDGAGRNCRLV